MDQLIEGHARELQLPRELLFEDPSGGKSTLRFLLSEICAFDTTSPVEGDNNTRYNLTQPVGLRRL